MTTHVRRNRDRFRHASRAVSAFVTSDNDGRRRAAAPIRNPIRYQAGSASAIVPHRGHREQPNSAVTWQPTDRAIAGQVRAAAAT